VREYLLVLCVAAGVTYLLTPVARRFAVLVGAMAAPRDRDVHAIPTPRLGGMAIYAGVCAAFLLASTLPALSRVFRYSDVQAIVLAGGVIVLLGMADDRWGIDALTKLAGQVLACGVMVLNGLELLTLTLPGVGAVSLGPESVPLTIVLALLTVNAINFIDGLDGLAAGVGAIAALAFFSFSYSLASGSATAGVAQDRITAPALIAVTLAGACLGFLPHNFNPARIFMGDSGSMLIGLMLAAAVTSLTGQVSYANLPPTAGLPVLLPLLLPFAVLAVPFVDLLLAVVRRTRAGRSPFAPDKAHLHHRLLEIGHSHTRAVLIMYCWTALLAFAFVAVSLWGGPFPVLAVAGTVAALALVASSVPRLRAAAGHRGRDLG
jgi:UDP-GlcNAc:undecaprenyl-phosphate/decaprenyl-phosphate GlcNAc-1-phosphate transferase